MGMCCPIGLGFSCVFWLSHRIIPQDSLWHTGDGLATHLCNSSVDNNQVGSTGVLFWEDSSLFFYVFAFEV